MKSERLKITSSYKTELKKQEEEINEKWRQTRIVESLIDRLEPIVAAKMNPKDLDKAIEHKRDIKQIISDFLFKEEMILDYAIKQNELNKYISITELDTFAQFFLVMNIERITKLSHLERMVRR